MTDNTTLVNIDDAGNINPVYYKTAALDIIKRCFDDRGLDPEKITTNHLQFALRECYYQLFEPINVKFPFNTCNIPYTAENIRALLRLYRDICELYRALPSLYAFERFTGLTEETVQKYVTDAALELGNARKTAIQNKLYEAPVGVITLANNDADSRLMYNRQNIADHAAVKKALDFSELVAIAKKNDGNG